MEDFINVIFRRPHQIQERVDHLNYLDGVEFVKRFQLSKRAVGLMLHQIEDLIRYRTERYDGEYLLTSYTNIS